jgi:hypothetical protein
MFGGIGVGWLLVFRGRSPIRGIVRKSDWTAASASETGR